MTSATATQKSAVQAAIVATLPMFTNMKKMEAPLLIAIDTGGFASYLAKKKVHGETVCHDTLTLIKAKVHAEHGPSHKTLSAFAIGESDTAYQAVMQSDDTVVSFLVSKEFAKDKGIANITDVAGIKVSPGTNPGTLWTKKS